MKNVKQRMIEDMKLRGLAPGTQERYLHTITALAKHYHRRPDELTQEQIKAYLLYLIETKGYAKSTLNVNLFAIKFLYQKTLGREWRFLQLTRVKTNRRLPIVLSRDEVWSLLRSGLPTQSPHESDVDVHVRSTGFRSRESSSRRH